MRAPLLLLVASLVALIGTCAAADIQTMFKNFKRDNVRVYASAEEEAKRFGIFADNMKKAQELMKANPHALFGANEFADMTAEEFKTRHNAQNFLRKRAAKPLRLAPRPVNVELPGSIDWRQKGAVTAVKNQGQCGSCWSFSTTGNIEGQWFLAGNPLVSLSEQELVSCDVIDDGCDGGFQDDAFQWLFFQREGVISTEASYPYVSGSGHVPACKTNGLQFGAKITAYEDIARDERIMAEQVAAKGPLAVNIDATSFQMYTSGILTNCISKEVDHAVLIVGFDMTHNPPYWVIKNSWGATWGEQGYIRIGYGTDQCLVSSMPTTAIVNSSGPAPPPPSPTTPAPPGPTPAPTGSFVQKHCSDSACSMGCQNVTFPTNTCLRVNGGGSAKVTCGTTTLNEQVYSTSDCTGSSQSATMPLNQCLQDMSGSYFENICLSGATLSLPAAHGKPLRVTKRQH